MKTKLIAMAALAAGGFVALQMVPTPDKVNPPVHSERRIQAQMHVPDAVSAILNKACRNCHSNETQWPWYGRLAPASWAVANDVAKARKAMNLSEWSVQAGRSPALAVATLSAACADMRSGRMPLKGYRMMHPESRLTGEEISTFCNWTESQTQKLLFSKRNQSGDLAAAHKETDDREAQ